MTPVPAVLLLDDGELVGVRTALGQLGVDFEHVVGFKGDRASVFRPDQLLVTSARLALQVESLRVADDSTDPVWVCAHNQDFLPMRERLRSLGVHYLVSSNLEARAMRMFFLQILHRGNERRRNARLQLNLEVRYELGETRGKGRIEELSRGGCRIVTSEEAAIGDQAVIQMPAELASGKNMSLTGIVTETLPASLRGEGEGYCAIVVFRDQEPESRAQIEAILTGENLGTRVTPLGPVPEAAANERPATLGDELETSGPSDRRDRTRHRFRSKVTILDPEAPDILLGRDLSTTGIRVDPHPSLTVGDIVSIALYGDEHDEPIVLEAEVLREDLGGFGLRFSDVSDAEKKWLDRVVKRLPGLQSLEANGGVGHSLVVSKLITDGQE